MKLKTIIHLTSIMILTFGCTCINNMIYPAPKEVRNFYSEISKNPEKLLNLKENFPDIILDTLLSQKLQDTIYLTEAVSFMKEYYYHQYSGKINFATYENIKLLFKDDFKRNDNIFNCNIEDIYACINLNPEKIFIKTFWIKLNNKYYLYNFDLALHYSLFMPH